MNQLIPVDAVANRIIASMGAYGPEVQQAILEYLSALMFDGRPEAGR